MRALSLLIALLGLGACALAISVSSSSSSRSLRLRDTLVHPYTDDVPDDRLPFNHTRNSTRDDEEEDDEDLPDDMPSHQNVTFEELVKQLKANTDPNAQTNLITNNNNLNQVTHLHLGADSQDPDEPTPEDMKQIKAMRKKFEAEMASLRKEREAKRQAKLKAAKDDMARAKQELLNRLDGSAKKKKEEIKELTEQAKKEAEFVRETIKQDQQRSIEDQKRVEEQVQQRVTDMSPDSDLARPGKAIEDDNEEDRRLAAQEMEARAAGAKKQTPTLHGKTPQLKVAIHFLNGYHNHRVFQYGSANPGSRSANYNQYTEEWKRFPDAFATLTEQLKDQKLLTDDVKQVTLYVGGFASVAGGGGNADDKNLELSENRAMHTACYIANWLEKRKIVNYRLHIGFYGRKRNSGKDAESQSHDRRVEITTTKPNDFELRFTWEKGSVPDDGRPVSLIETRASLTSGSSRSRREEPTIKSECAKASKWQHPGFQPRWLDYEGVAN